MHYAKMALRVAIAIVALAILIPILFYIGIAALGLAVVGSIGAWFAGRRISKHMRENDQRWTARDGGVIIDHE